MTDSLARVPCTIVTGFLGAGKTTLIRHVLAHAKGRRLAIVVNEFGDVGIDGEILKGCGDADVAELVDQHGEPAAAGVGQQVADQRRLAGAEEAGDDGAGQLGERGHRLVPVGRGGMRAITPALKMCGRWRHGMMPAGAAA